MRISIVVAVSENDVIGKDGKIPWYLPTDLKRFKSITLGGTVVMGRKTWDSIPEKFRPLPERRNIVLTRNKDFEAPGAEIIHSFDELERFVGQDEEIFVIGGESLYRMTLPKATGLYLTEVRTTVSGGDTFFRFDIADGWRLEKYLLHSRGEKDEHPHNFFLFTREDPSKKRSFK